MSQVIKQYAKKLALSGALIGAMGTAYAVSPHFVGKVTSTINNATGAVQICFKEAGLGNNQNIDYIASGTATATYVCRNAGGNCPNAANKKTVTAPVNASGTFNSGNNGMISACLTIAPPSAGTFTCPSGQRVVLSSVSFSGLGIIDDSNEVGPVIATPSVQSINKGACPAP
jgi:hypothetical protein